jgi:hypothetical protein
MLLLEVFGILCGWALLSPLCNILLGFCFDILVARLVFSLVTLWLCWELACCVGKRFASVYLDDCISVGFGPSLFLFAYSCSPCCAVQVALFFVVSALAVFEIFGLA